MNALDFLYTTGIGHYLLVFLISMVPVVESLGAIPIGVGLGLNPWVALIVATIGNMVPAPFIILFIRRVFAWIRIKIPKLESWVSRLEKKAMGEWNKVKKYEAWALFAFVALPLPGTGVWTGCLAAALLDMRLRDSLPAIFGGIVVNAVAVTALTYGVKFVVS